MTDPRRVTEAGTTTLIVRYVPPSPNRMRGLHWAAAMRERRACSWMVHAARAGNRDVQADGRHAELRFTIHAAGTPRDADNALASLKPLIDALAEHGLIVDDSPEWVTLEVPRWERSKRVDARVEITIRYSNPNPNPRPEVVRSLDRKPRL